VLWREFIAAWLWPIFFFAGALLAKSLNSVRGYLWIPVAVLFFYAFGRLGLLWMRRKVGYVSLVVWGMLLPFITWGMLVGAARWLGLLGAEGAA